MHDFSAQTAQYTCVSTTLESRFALFRECPQTLVPVFRVEQGVVHFPLEVETSFEGEVGSALDSLLGSVERQRS